jgi:hypothetical protein
LRRVRWGCGGVVITRQDLDRELDRRPDRSFSSDHHVTGIGLGAIGRARAEQWGDFAHKIYPPIE